MGLAQGKTVTVDNPLRKYLFKQTEQITKQFYGSSQSEFVSSLELTLRVMVAVLKHDDFIFPYLMLTCLLKWEDLPSINILT